MDGDWIIVINVVGIVLVVGLAGLGRGRARVRVRERGVEGGDQEWVRGKGSDWRWLRVWRLSLYAVLSDGTGEEHGRWSLASLSEVRVGLASLVPVIEEGVHDEVMVGVGLCAVRGEVSSLQGEGYCYLLESEDEEETCAVEHDVGNVVSFTVRPLIVAMTDHHAVPSRWLLSEQLRLESNRPCLMKGSNLVVMGTCMSIIWNRPPYHVCLLTILPHSNLGH